MPNGWVQDGVEAGIGAGLLTTPLWALILHDISLIASTVAAVCGAIIGIHAVWRMRKRMVKEI